MTEVIRRTRLAANANAIICNNINSGITWGSNNLPPYGLAGWFAGPNSGQGSLFAYNQFNSGEPNASQAGGVLQYIANVMSGIRLIRVVIYRTHFSLGTEVIYDGTAMGNTVYNTNFGGAIGLGGLGDNTNMDLNVFNQACNNIWSGHVGYNRSSALLLTNTICHTSCHTSCHSSRGRR